MHPFEQNEPKVKVAARSQAIDANLIGAVVMGLGVVLLLLGRAAGGM